MVQAHEWSLFPCHRQEEFKQVVGWEFERGSQGVTFPGLFEITSQLLQVLFR